MRETEQEHVGGARPRVTGTTAEAKRPPRSTSGGNEQGLFSFAGGEEIDPRGPPAVDTGPASGRVQRPLAMTVALFAVLALAMGTWITQHGVASPGDGLTYVSVAQNIVDGKGITQPFINEYDSLSPSTSARVVGHSPMLAWPPLYPVTLAAGSPVGLTPLAMARLLCIVSFAILVGAVTALAGQASRGSILAAALAGTMVMLSPHLLLLAGTSSTDLAGAALAVPALLALPRLASRGGRWLLAVVWLSVVVASLTRILYVGLALAVVASIVLLRPAGRRRWIDAGVASTAAVPLGLWFVWAHSVIASDRGADSYYANWGSKVTDVLSAMRTMFIPDGQLLVVRVAMILLLVALGLTASVTQVRRREARRAGLPSRSDAGPPVSSSWWPVRRLPGWLAGADAATATRVTLALVGVSTVVTFMGALITAGYSLSIDARSLLPLQIPIVVAFAVIVAPLLPHATRELPRGLVPLVAIGLLGVTMLVAVVNPSPWLGDGLQRFQPTPRHDDALTSALGGHDLVFTDSPSTVYGLSGHPAAMLPLMVSPAVGKPRESYGRDLDELSELTTTRDVVFVFSDFAQFLDRGIPREQEMIDRFHLRLIATVSGARVYQRDPT